MYRGRGVQARTGVGSGGGGGSTKVTGASGLALPLEVAVDGIGAVGSHSVGLEADAVLLDWVAVGTGPTGVVQRLLQDCIT